MVTGDEIESDVHNLADSGVINIKYSPTICHRCTKLLCHTYVERDEVQPEPAFYIYCEKCFRDIVPVGTYLGTTTFEKQK